MVIRGRNADLKEGRGPWRKAGGKFFFGEGNGRAIIPQLVQIRFGRDLRIDQCPGRFCLRTNQVCPGETGNHHPGQQEDQYFWKTRGWTTQDDHTHVNDWQVA